MPVIFQGFINSGSRLVGYMKVWLDGKLVLDHWRKAWNPAPALISMYI